MKYKDKHIEVTSELIPIFDINRPTPALIKLFNTEQNTLAAQATGIVIRATAIVHELSHKVSIGILDTTFHCVMPIVIYSRQVDFDDTFYSVSNKLVIRDCQIARDLLVSVQPRFFDNSNQLVEAIFKAEDFTYLIFNIEDDKSIRTAVDLLSRSRGVISIHNPNHKNTTQLMKYCIDKNVHLIEHIDGSTDVYRF
ncbi:MAG: hypothetical protein CBC42_05940 [Betaproteobacteria bacterium TMED82]|nr:MAG: hypothetical protein CBC42_05940 [Betaproteobacteria bacterium TMED82]|tara:strand:+ start:33678 stop:34265 length:588 start_codon:yes stop_codon:yes gene_type:complete